MPVAALMLLIPLPIISRLELLKSTELGNAELRADLSSQQRLGKNPFSGIGILFSNPFLLAIGLFIPVMLALEWRLAVLAAIATPIAVMIAVG